MRAADYEAIQLGTDVWNEYTQTQWAAGATWRADLTGADLTGADLTRALLTGAKLTRATLNGANLHQAVLTEGNLIGADLSRANLTEGTLTRVDLTDAVLIRTNLTRVNLIRAEMNHANLLRADLADADLTEASLHYADLTEAGLGHADLTGADLTDANLTGADLTDVVLARAVLRDTDLYGTDLTRACLSRADLSGAHLAFTVLADVDVSSFCASHGLTHWRPSYIDARTMIRSYTHPRIVQFMVDCGIPETFALYMVDCARAENQGDLLKMMHSTLISYGGPDQDFAEKIYRALKPTVQVWFFPKSAKWGQRVETEAYRGVQQHDRILLLCSRESLNRTGVIQEIRETLARESRDDAIYLLPVRLDDYLFDTDGWINPQPELCQRLRDRVIGDFRDARTDQAAFDQAIHELKQQLMKDRPGA